MPKPYSRKDWCLIIVYTSVICICLYHIIAVIPPGTSKLSALSDIIIVLLALVTWIEVSRVFNLSIFVPDFYINEIKSQHNEMAKNAINQYIEYDRSYIKQYDMDRIRFFMSQLELTRDQYDDIQLQLIKMQTSPHGRIGEARKKMEELIKCDKSIVVKQSEFSQGDLTYDKVGYFLNLIDLMFDPRYSKQITGIFYTLIMDVLKNDLQKIKKYKIVVPYDSNFLLSVHLGDKLKIPVVRMRNGDGKIMREQRWDGVLNPMDKLIMIHDVLVSGEQVTHALDNLPKTCAVDHFFCLVSRKEFDGCAVLKERGLTVHALLEMDDNDIARLIQ